MEITATELVEQSLLNPINNGLKPALPVLNEPLLVTNISAMKGKENTLLELSKLVIENGYDVLMIPKADKPNITERDFLEKQLSFLESVDDNELQDTPTNREFVKIIQTRSEKIIESVDDKELILAYATVCYFANNPMVRHFFPEADGLKLLVKYEMMYGFLSYVETDFFPDVDVDWKTRIIVDYYSQNRERE